MRRTTVVLILALFALPAAACLWDDDTLLDERRGLPGVAEILAGKWERHSAFFYEHRVKAMTAALEKDPNDLAAYDNLAVALEKLGKVGQAIEVMLTKDQLKPGEYTTHANLGTFYLHAGDFDNGVAHIRKAIEINPDAHFGREKYQLMAAEYLLEVKKDPTLLELGSFVLPELFDLPGVHRAGSDAPLRQRLSNAREAMWRRRDRDLEPTRNAIEGVVGMIRFGTGTSPHLYHALGDLLAHHGDKHLAARAYRRALHYNHPEPELLKKALKAVEDLVEHHDDMSETRIAAEQADAEAWVEAYQQYEDDLVRAGRPPSTEADYAAFYEKHGSARPRLPPADVAHNTLQKLLRTGRFAGALAALLIVLGLGKLAWVLTRRKPAPGTHAGT